MRGDEGAINWTIRIILLVMIFVIAFFLTGCKVEETKEEKVKDLDYTICDESKLPDALVELIQEKRKEPFKLTYRTKDYLYIVVGYGAQDRTDLSILLKELYLTENAIFVETQLESTQGEKLEEDKMSYPWIAIKCQLYDLQVIFK
ncbi:MAG: protease complex subunit PrcB family protein [Lachnospiraceae bacterium]|nr:protease complex subunit PrcB family protein [Lachnospiraceae bacterium]